MIDPAQAEAILANLSAAEAEALIFDWSTWARPDQLCPNGDFRTWVLLGGRGSGKTRSASEHVRSQIEAGKRAQIGLVAPTQDSLRRDQVEGVSGLLRIAPPRFQPTYEPSNRRITYPNGAVAHLFSAEQPDLLRGPNLDLVWCDEFCVWSNQTETWQNLNLCCRVPGPRGDPPRVVISTTPKPSALFRGILNDPSTRVTRSRTRDNAHHLAPAALAYYEKTYAGTTLGRQEMDAELLDDHENAIWHRALIEQNRIQPHQAPRFYDRVVVAIDPSLSFGPDSDEAGIVCCGVLRDRGEAYVIEDRSMRASPQTWARAAIELAHRHLADALCYEANVAGRLVETVIRQFDRNIRIRAVHARHGKALRAEPVLAKYEQGLVKHVGMFPALEDEMCSFVPGERGPSPNRLDALVYCITELLLKPRSVRERRPSPQVIPLYAAR